MKRLLISLVCLGALCALTRPAAAQIAIDQLQIQNSPDVRGWTPAATITRIEFWRGAGIHFEFDKRATWPDVVPQGWDGPVQYTVWILLNIGGRWYGSGVIECWRDRPSTDDADVTANNEIAVNWLYDGRWGPMQGHQPRPGERVGFMLTAGDARGKDVHGVAERTRIVEIAWPATSGAAPQVLWTENEQAAAPAPPDLPAFASGFGAASPAPPVPADLSPVLGQLAAIEEKVDQLARDEDEFHTRVHDAWEKTGAVFLKYIAPAIAAFFGGKAIQ